MIDKIKEHPLVAAIMIVQIAFLLLLFTKSCITPRQIVNVDMESFAVDGENAYLQGGSMVFRNQGSIGDDNWLNVSTEEMGVPSGAYRVDIAYDSDVNGDKINEYNANVSISSKWRISFDAVTLDDQNHLVSGKLWIPFCSNCVDLKINISYNGNGTLQINSITLTEALRYRFMRVLGFGILFLLIDMGIILFFTNAEVRINKSHAILLLITIAASLPFFSGTLFEIGGQDLWCHLRRLASVAEGLENGQFPVRMNTELNNGYGYPWSLYYCDIFLYPSAILYLMSVPLRTCYQIYVIMVNAATTIFTYLAAGKFTKRTSVKLLGTGLYVLCIYRLVNVNLRAAAGEYTAMTFLPLIVAGLFLIYTKEKPGFKDWLYLTCGMSGVIMSHVLTGEMIALNIVLFCIVLFKKTLNKDVIGSLLKAAVLTLGITAWFLVPFLDYYMHHVTLVQKGDLRLLENTTQELIFLFQMFAPGKNAGRYLTIGLPLILGIALLLFCLNKYKKEGQKTNLLRLISGFAFLNILFVSKYFPWGRIQNHLGIDGAGYQVGTLQFAWRFLSLASLLLVFAMIVAMGILAEHNGKAMRRISFALVGCIVISVGFFYYRFTDEVWSTTYNIMQPYSGSDNLYLLDGTDTSVQNQSRPEVLSGNVIVSNSYREQGIYKLNVENLGDTEAEVSVPIYAYRYFNAYDETGTLLDKNSTDSNCISVKVPALYRRDHCKIRSAASVESSRTDFCYLYRIRFMEAFHPEINQENEDRQLLSMKGLSIPKKNIFMDKQSGKDFERPEYKKMLRRFKKNDLLYIKSIDRLGRNYAEILEQWRILTKDKGIDIVVLDMPLLDTRRGKDLMGAFLSDIVLQVLSFVAENERTNIRQRQAEGIAAAKARGIRFGRPPSPLPECFHDAYQRWKADKITGTAAARECGMPLSTFRYRAEIYEKTAAKDEAVFCKERVNYLKNCSSSRSSI